MNHAKILLLTLTASALWAQAPARGFSPAGWEQQRQLEEKARAIPSPVRARSYIETMSARPHHAGSAGSKQVAEYALGLFREWGYQAEMEEFDALLPFPTSRRLEMTAPRAHTFSLREPVIADDPDSNDENQLPTYNAYGASGDVTGPIIYVNYGIPADYDELKKIGVDVKGKIVLARYGQSWRGTKVKVAQEHGALGCLIYSDPRDDGYWNGRPFPDGPYRPAQSVQRGSVMDMPLYVGDPLTPGWASVKGTRRLEPREAASLMKIPVLPISYTDAQVLLEQLDGPVAKPEWRGALPLTYHIGPGPAAARLAVDYDWSSKPLYNVVAKLPGGKHPDQWVIYGNHHDAWVNGASDPVSGAAALLETARALAELVRQGWRPSRTVVFALWDAEEFGLIGSTEWVEKHKAELQSKTAVYINSDSNNPGTIGASGSPVLEAMMREVLSTVKDPKTEKPLVESARSGRGTETEKEFRLGALGAGSDYVAFIHHAGIASLNLGFSGPGANGVYHSIYDSFAWYSRYMDKDFIYSRALAQVMATTLLRFSEADVLPYEFAGVAQAVKRWIEDLRKSGVSLDAIDKELAAMEQESRRYEQALAGLLRKGSNAAALNAHLLRTEQHLTEETGLPGRPFYRHLLHAPGSYTGYGVKTLAGVRESIEAGRKEEAAAEAVRVVGVLRKMRIHIEAATAMASQ